MKSTIIIIIGIILGVGVLYSFSHCISDDVNPNESSSVNSTESGTDEESSGLSVTILDVGKADCIVIEDGENVVVIDAAEDEDYAIVDGFLKESKIEKIDYLIITHYDKDHVGGAAQLIKDYNVENVVEPNYEKDSKHVVRYRQALDEKEIIPTKLKEDIMIEFSEFELQLFPTKIVFEDDNNHSIIAVVEYSDKKLLFMGDAEKERISEFLESNTSTYDFIKMPHHGRFNKMTESLIQKTQPKQAVITCSKKHPAEESTLEILEKYNVITDKTVDGSVNITYK